MIGFVSDRSRFLPKFLKSILHMHCGLACVDAPWRWHSPCGNFAGLALSSLVNRSNIYGLSCCLQSIVTAPMHTCPAAPDFVTVLLHPLLGLGCSSGSYRNGFVSFQHSKRALVVPICILHNKLRTTPSVPVTLKTGTVLTNAL